jgi:hypothetical protein
MEGINLALTGTGLSLTDIGSSQDEVNRYLSEAHKSIAKGFLMRWRSTGVVGVIDFESFLDHLKKGGLTPEDIRSDQTEIDQFRSVAYRR